MMRKMSEVCDLFNLDRNYLMRLKEGLLPPTTVDSSGLKTALYDEEAVERLWMIVLLHKELGYKLEVVGKILDNPDFDRIQCLGEQIEALEAKVEHLKKVITVAEAMRTTGLKPQDILDTSNMTATEYVEMLAQEIESVSPEMSKRMYSLFHDKAFDDSYKRVVSFNRNGLSAESDEAQAEIKNLEVIFIKHLGKSGKASMKRFGEILRAKGLLSKRFDEVMGEDLAAYVGAAIIYYCTKENNHE